MGASAKSHVDWLNTNAPLAGRPKTGFKATEAETVSHNSVRDSPLSVRIQLCFSACLCRSFAHQDHSVNWRTDLHLSNMCRGASKDESSGKGPEDSQMKMPIAGSLGSEISACAFPDLAILDCIAKYPLQLGLKWSPYMPRTQARITASLSCTVIRR